MRIMVILSVSASLALATLLAGCSEMPAKTVQEAEVALQAVETAGAAEYAPGSQAAAAEAMSQLQAELQAQQGKFALLRKYDRASALAVEAKRAADQAVAEAQQTKDKARQETVETVATTRALLEEVRQLLAAAPRGKGSEADLRVLQADLVGVEGALVEVDSTLTAGRFLVARAKADAAMQSVQNVKSSIEAAMALRSRSRAG